MADKLRSLKLPFAKHDRPKTIAAFHAVVIRCTAASCAAAKNLQGEPYLAVEAPLLPLANCDRSTRCKCSYQHRDDRRRGPRRAEETDAPSLGWRAYEEQRRSNGRRAEDSSPAYGNWDPLDDTYYDFVAKKYR
jgi:hypothetical protein